MAKSASIWTAVLTLGLSLYLTAPAKAEAIAVYKTPSTLTTNPCEAHLSQGLPKIPSPHTLVVRNLYCLSNNPTTKFADWVAYTVRAELMDGPKRDRNFRGDPDLPREDTLEDSDYQGAYASLDTNKGHLAPLGSFDGAEDWYTVNYLSNITPQRSALNQGVWGDLEDLEREMAATNPVHVITGPAYLREMAPLPGANEDHVMPSGFWKIITTSAGSQAYFFDQDTVATEPEQGEISIESLESMIGIDFAENGYGLGGGE